MSFEGVTSTSPKKIQFTLLNTGYSYANTLRRAIMTEVPQVAFRSDPPGIVVENSDIKVLKTIAIRNQMNFLLTVLA